MVDYYENESSHVENKATTAKPRQNLVVIPVLPRPMAIFCLVANTILPGSGTIVSAFAVFCFAECNTNNCFEMIKICLANVLVGLCQLATVMFLLIGWIWSIIWGCALVGHSNNYRKDERPTTTSTTVPVRLTVKPAISVRDEG